MAHQYPPDAGARPFLLTVRGTIAAPGLEQAREIHNATAGAPPSVAAARGAGDLSHNVYAAVGRTDELLFIDVWNSLSGLAGFFGNHNVQAAAAQLFATRDNPVWSLADGFGNVFLPTPGGRRATGVGMLRTQVTSMEKAAAAFSTYAAATLNLARASGLVTRSTWVRVPEPGHAAPAELINMDTWLDVDAMNAYYDGRHGFELVVPVFAGQQDTTVWAAAPGQWSEW
jgi:hypothetical protein